MLDSKTKRQEVVPRNVRGYVSGAMMLFEGVCFKLYCILTITDHSSKSGTGLPARDENGMLKCTQVKDSMKKKRIKWTENTGHTENPQSVRKALMYPSKDGPYLFMLLFW